MSSEEAQRLAKTHERHTAIQARLRPLTVAPMCMNSRDEQECRTRDAWRNILQGPFGWVALVIHFQSSKLHPSAASNAPGMLYSWLCCLFLPDTSVLRNFRGIAIIINDHLCGLARIYIYCMDIKEWLPMSIVGPSPRSEQLNCSHESRFQPLPIWNFPGYIIRDLVSTLHFAYWYL